MRSEKAGKRRSLPAKLLIALGVAAQLISALALVRVDPVLEYAVPAPEIRRIEASGDQPARTDSGLESRIEALEGVSDALGDAAAAISMSGEKTGAAISFEGQTAEATLTGVESRWLEICPRRLVSGRWMDEGEISAGARVAALDEDLAFALFGSEAAEDREIEIDGGKYRVIGVLRHHRGVGEADEFAAYVPLRAISRHGAQLETLTLHALSAVSAGMGQSLESAARDAWGPGTLHDLQKERMGALLLSRLILSAFALALIFRLGRGLIGQIRRGKLKLDERRRHAYLRGWLGSALLLVLGALLGAALLLMAVYAVLSFAIAPVYRFTEWVPESLVSIKALRTVFWSRAAEGARLICVRTPASARIAFWGAMDRFGAVALLLGLALGRKKVQNASQAGNQFQRTGV